MIEAIRYFHASTLMELEQMMPALIAQGWQPTGTLSVDPSMGGWDFYQTMIKGDATAMPSNTAAVTDGLTYSLSGSDGATDQAVTVTPVVVNSRVDRFKLPASAAVVKNNDTVSVRNSAGANGKGSTAVVTSAGAITSVNLPATTGMVDNGSAVAVQNSAGTSVLGTHPATVSSGVLQNIKLAATIAPVSTGDSVSVQNSAGSAVAGTHSAMVNAGALSNVKLAANIAAVASGSVLASLPVTNNAILAIGTANRQVTVNVANGVITGLTIV